MMLKDAKLPADSVTDPWIAAFICELHVLFGTPVSGKNCTTKEDKIQYLWAVFGIANALSQREEEWRGMRNKIEPEIAAEVFARRYFDTTNKMIIEQIPAFSDRGEQTKPFKSLPGPGVKN